MPEIEELKQKLADCEKTAADNLAGWKRAKADFINLQRDIERSRQSWAQFAALDLVKELIPFWISFDQLLAGLPPDVDQGRLNGLKQLHQMLEDFFSRQGVSKIESVGKDFDPEWHEAVGREKHEGVPSNQVIREIAPGFRMNNKLIFPPKVIVAE